MTISYLTKACVSALFLVIALASTNAIANTQRQTFSGEPEKVKPFVPKDIRLFSRLGDFIDPNNLGLTVLSIEDYRSLSESHPRRVKSVFFAYSPENLHKAYRQISVPKIKARIPSRHISGSTIITIANLAKYKLSSLIKKHPDVVILIGAGNSSKSKPENAVKRYDKYAGTNIFYGGGTRRDSEHLHPSSSKPGKYGYAYIADDYLAYDLKGGTRAGTSYAIQITSVKLAMLYKALNVNHTWSLQDAMQLLMTTRKNVEQGLYQSDLTKLLAKDEFNRMRPDENGKTHLLPEATLREMLSTSPLYKNQ